MVVCRGVRDSCGGVGDEVVAILWVVEWYWSCSEGGGRKEGKGWYWLGFDRV